MCTVSFYQNKHKTIITSNRDENIARPIALAPQAITMGNHIVYCPIDPQSNGTWFGVKDEGSVYVLLNGADKKHIPKPPYRKSRGLILMDIIAENNVITGWNDLHLEDIEPFTVVVYQNEQLLQLRWNGKEKSHLALDTKIAHIWSSATLYSDDIIQQRKRWFEDFLNRQEGSFEEHDFIQFHTNTHKNDRENGLIINRNHTYLTKNITQCVIENNQFTMNHFDLIGDKKSTITQQYDKTLVA